MQKLGGPTEAGAEAGVLATVTEADLVRLVQAEKCRLLYRQSFQGVFSSLVAASFWMALMWNHAARTALMWWAGLLALASILRTIVFLLFQRRGTDDNASTWIGPYAATVGVSALIWGVGTTLVMPADSFLHQVMTYVFLVGLAGAALSAYGVFRGMTIGIVCAVLLPCTLYLLWRGERESILLALAGIWFFLTTLRAIGVHNQTVEQSFRRGHQLAEAKRIAETQARTDSLTGMFNRRAFTDAADALLKVAVREGRSATMILIDIDDFKRINDNHGHATGDAALLHVARLLTDGLRASDVCGRLGGDEFAVLLPNTDLAAATDVAEKLRQAIAQRPLPTGGGLPMTLSIGVAGDAFDVENLLNHADAAMYRAKRAGKNRIAAAV